MIRFKPRSLPPLVSTAALLLLSATQAVAAAAPQSVQDLLAQTDDVLKQMSQLTGLPIKGTLKKQVISRAQAEQYLIADLHAEMTPEEIHAQEALVRALGLVSSDFNLEKFLVSFYTEQAAGFYDPQRQTMFLADWIPAEVQKMALAHELTHALQDQNWGLDKYLHGASADDDATAARLAVVEGYATAAMLQPATAGLFGLESLPSLTPMLEGMLNQQFDAYPAFSNAPYYFRMRALFPYVQGLGFIQSGLQHGGWKSLDALFQRPPQNTQQIFDPASYFTAHAFAIPTLSAPEALAEGFRLLRENSLGELGYYSLLGQLVSAEEAKKLGPAWRGDRYLLYERTRGNQCTIVARSVWSDSETSLAFFRDYHTNLSHKYPDLVVDPRSGADLFVGSSANGVTLVLRKGNECFFAEGIPAGQADAILTWLRAQ